MRMKISHHLIHSRHLMDTNSWDRSIPSFVMRQAHTPATNGRCPNWYCLFTSQISKYTHSPELKAKSLEYCLVPGCSLSFQLGSTAGIAYRVHRRYSWKIPALIRYGKYGCPYSANLFSFKINRMSDGIPTQGISKNKFHWPRLSKRKASEKNEKPIITNSISSVIEKLTQIPVTITCMKQINRSITLVSIQMWQRTSYDSLNPVSIIVYSGIMSSPVFGRTGFHLESVWFDGIWSHPSGTSILLTTVSKPLISRVIHGGTALSPELQSLNSLKRRTLLGNLQNCLSLVRLRTTIIHLYSTLWLWSWKIGNGS